tara:strand:+ start:1831 stop:2142 length:312 start_codon:yes stop_codon:yes gene_type:complete
MKYADNQTIELGDIVELDMPKGRERARVVMLGDTYKHLMLDSSFETWVKNEKILKADSIVVEWIDKNPLEHSDHNYAPVGNYMFTGISKDIKLIARGDCSARA